MRANMAQSFFEATTEQKRMATIGREMMDWSELKKNRKYVN